MSSQLGPLKDNEIQQAQPESGKASAESRFSYFKPWTWRKNNTSPSTVAEQITKIEPIVKTESSDKVRAIKTPKASKEKTVITAKETAKTEGIFSKLMTYTAAGVAVGVNAASSVLYGVANLGNYAIGNRHGEQAMEEGKKRMLKSLGDPQFVEFYQIINKVVIDSVTSKLNESSFPLNTLQGFSKELIEINLSNAFANLAETLEANKHTIPNYANQNSLANLMILFNQRMGAKLPSMEELNNMNPEERKIAFGRVSNEVLKFLLPNGLNDVKLNLGGSLGEGAGIGIFSETLLDWVKSEIGETLFVTYNSLMPPSEKIDQWKRELQAKLGLPNEGAVNTFTESPVTFLKEYLKGLIQGSPSTTKAVGSVLDDILITKPAINQVKDKKSQNVRGLYQGIPVVVEERRVKQQKEKETDLGALSQGPLAGWILSASQTFLQSDVPSLQPFQKFIDKSIENLALGVLAKGTDLVMPKEKQSIPQDKFLKELIDRSISRLNDLSQKEAVSKADIETFIKDLPIPPFLQGVVVENLYKQLTQQKQALVDVKRSWAETQEKYDKAIRKMNQYDNGQELISLTEKLTDLVVESTLGQNLDLIKTFGFETQLEELFAQFFPGIEISPELKQWLQSNIQGLGKNESGNSAEAVALLKKAIQATLLQSFVNTIEVNFQNKSEKFAAQLLNRLREAFQKSFATFNDQDKTAVKEALIIQKEIGVHKKKQEGFVLEINDFYQALSGLPEKMSKLIKHSLHLHQMSVQASKTVRNLETALEKSLSNFNASRSVNETVWNQAKINRYKKALEFRKECAPQLEELKKKKPHLEEIAFFKAILIDFEARQNPTHSDYDQMTPEVRSKAVEYMTGQSEYCRDMIALLSLSQDRMKMFEDYISAESTLPQAKKQEILAKKELAAIRKVITNTNLTALSDDDKKIWRRAKNGMDNLQIVQEKIEEENTHIENLNKLLETKLSCFKTLSNELLKILNLNDESKLPLSDFLKEKIGPQLLNAKERFIPKILFEQLCPVIMQSLEREANQDKLKNLMGSNGFNIIARAVSEEAMNQIPSFITYQAVSNDIARIIASVTRKNMNDNLASLSLSLEDAVKNSKESLTSQQLIEICGRLIIANGGNEFTDSQKLEILKSFDNEQIMAKINKVVITPKQIAGKLNEALPGVSDFQKLIAPQLEEVILGQNTAFKENREYLRSYIEDNFVKIFIKAAERNRDGDFFDKLKEKMKEIALIAAKKELSQKEIEQQFNEKIITGILGITTPDVLVDLPPFLREIVFDAVTHQMTSQLVPILMPMITLEKDKGLLAKKSSIMSALCTATAKSLLSFIPESLSSYQLISEKIFKTLSDGKGTKEQFNQFNDKVLEIVKNSEASDEPGFLPTPIKNKALLQAYKEVMGDLSQEKSDQILQKLKEIKAKEQLTSVLIQTESIISGIQKNVLPTLTEENRIELNRELYKFIHSGQSSYTSLIDFIEPYVEGALIKVFIKMEEKNPSKDGKDSLTVITEKLLDKISVKFQNFFKESQDIRARLIQENPGATPEFIQELVSKELDVLMKTEIESLNNEVLKNILGIDSAQAFEGLPPTLQALAYDNIKDQMNSFVHGFFSHLKTLESTDKATKEARKNIEKTVESSCITTFLQDLGQFIVVATPHSLAEMVDDKSKGVINTSESTLSLLENLSHDNLNIAKVLLQHASGTNFEKMLGGVFEGLKGKDQATTMSEKTMEAGKAKAAEFISNALVDPLNRGLEKLFAAESDKARNINGRLITNLMKVTANHFELVKLAKDRAKARGESHFTHEDFVAVAGSNLHRAVPTHEPDYKRSIDEIQDRLGIKLSTEQELNIKTTLIQLAHQDSSGVRPLRLNLLIKSLEEGLNITLTKEQLENINKADDKGLTLKDIIREDANVLKTQRDLHFYKQTNKDFLKALFPNGRNDLTFVQPELRGPVWKMLKNQLMPMVMPMMVELLLDPDMMTTMVVNGLDNMNQSLKGPIVVEEERTPFYKEFIGKVKNELALDSMTIEQEQKLNEELIKLVQNSQQSKKPIEIIDLIKTLDQVLGAPITASQQIHLNKLYQNGITTDMIEMDELDRATGSLLKHIIDMTKLPPWAIKMMKNENGEISSTMAKSLGGVLRDQFNEKFFKTTVQTALKSLTTRDTSGKPVLSFDTRPSEIKIESLKKERIENEKKLGKLLRESVDVGITYYLRSQWAQLQAKWDKQVEKHFGKIGKDIKNALDKVFHFAFITILGNLVSFALYPLTWTLKQVVYKVANLNENKDILMDILRKAPKDQPLAPYAIYNENLMFNLMDAFRDTFKEEVA